MNDILGKIYVPSKYSQSIFTLVSWDVSSVNQLLERIYQYMCLDANVDSSFHGWAIFSIKNKNQMNQELAEACNAIKKGAELRIFANLVMHARHMEDRLGLV